MMNMTEELRKMHDELLGEIKKYNKMAEAIGAETININGTTSTITGVATTPKVVGGFDARYKASEFLEAQGYTWATDDHFVKGDAIAIIEEDKERTARSFTTTWWYQVKYL